VHVTALVINQRALFLQESVGFLAACAGQRQRGGGGINTRANALRAGFWPFLFLRQPGPHSLVFQAIETDGYWTGNGGAFSHRKRLYFSALGSRGPQGVPVPNVRFGSKADVSRAQM
jgi:hypothetical protein